ncbi:TRAP transporter small permease [Lentibacillus amyloliquefaciens]|uniref:Tripartite ATP-independent periplasmic transporters DctQ component domain-containing protein n=1 Tax=Lentibacillus amyloliquefaciens TaxID=1472767 RepID=A0A0U4FFY4_9BACI|nr:TRAP transporter small permease subunit [Lentibacillus amyloliquefaciens]ALX47582.1 hypothetical protein AOX59_02560 [Lentibacillus amyloliquefaciens]
MKLINIIIAIHEWIKKLFLVISGIALVGMMLFISLDVGLRNIIGSSIPGSYEYAENYFMPFIVFPALAFVYTTGILPRVLNLVSKFPNQFQHKANLCLRIIDLIIFTLIFYFSLKYAIDGTIQGKAFVAGGNLVPLYPALFIAPLGVFVLLVEIIIETIKDIKFKRLFPDQVDE